MGLRNRYSHFRIRHKERIYVEGNVHTNTIEGFFGNLKTGIRGTYHSVSRRWLPSYRNEYVWRCNHRSDERAQFESLDAGLTSSRALRHVAGAASYRRGRRESAAAPPLL